MKPIHIRWFIQHLIPMAYLAFFSVPCVVGATFHPGDRGDQVLAVQQQLAADGYAITPDGDYGTATTEALKQFQADHGLEADGILGEATYEALMGTDMPENDSTTFVQHTGLPTEAPKEASLADIQQALSNQGYSVDIDGIFGKGTEDAVRQFQANHGLEADGVIGPATYEAILGYPMPAGKELMKIESRFVTGGAAKAVAASAPMAPTASQDPVITLQQALANHGYDVAVDGVFGVGTENAVRDFQSNNGLEVDGVVGAATYYELTGQFLPGGALRRFGNGGYGGSTMVDDRAQRLMGIANQYIGVPYVFGGNDPSGFDCSGFTRYVYSAVGIDLPRMADEQYNMGYEVSRPFLQPGDLVFFSTYLPGVSHVGIYIGNNQFIDASSDGVSVDSLDSSYWAQRYVGAKRVF